MEKVYGKLLNEENTWDNATTCKKVVIFSLHNEDKVHHKMDSASCLVHKPR